MQFLKTVPTGSNKKTLLAAVNMLEDETSEDSESLLDPKDPDFKNLGSLIFLLLGYFGEESDSIFKTCEVSHLIKKLNLIQIVVTFC